jgi:hypothetical protein
MMKNRIIVLLLSIIPLITIGQKSNLYFGSSIDYGSNPRTYGLTAQFINPTIDIMAELINNFGESYSLRGDSYFTWEKVRVKQFSKKPLDIIVVKRIDNSAGDKNEYYDITIKEGGKQFLKETKFRHRKKVKRFFESFAQTI